MFPYKDENPTERPAVITVSIIIANVLAFILVQGAGAQGVSSGTATKEMAKLFQQLPKDAGYELTGLSFEEEASGAQAPALYGLSILVIYLCLAALYESWAIPLSVMLVIPLGVIGALIAYRLEAQARQSFLQRRVIDDQVQALAAEKSIREIKPFSPATRKAFARLVKLLKEMASTEGSPH